VTRTGARPRVVLAALVLATLVGAGPATIAAPVDPWLQVAREVAALAPSTSFLVAEVEGDGCRAIAGANPEQRVGIASTFKLYVLAELARQIATDQAEWDEELAITPALKSMPSGELVYEAPGTRHTLLDLASRMIAKSDNTATDHLIARLGRENVEAVQPLFGHGAPELNTPLLMTRELFAIKMAADPDFVAAYVAAPDDEQRRLLEAEIDPRVLSPDSWGNWNGPAWIDSVEWFASAQEVCTALARLSTMATRPGLEPLARILATNRGGTVFERGTWPYAAFKEGYEAGVCNLTWLVQRDDGRRFVVTAGFNNPDVGVDRDAAWRLMERVPGLLRTVE
jgi:hypothetical protein